MKNKSIKKSEFDIMMSECVTIVGLKHYFGGVSIEKGSILLCKKESNNEKDHEAISVNLPVIEKIGYIANNTYTVLKGTQSAGRIYDKVEDKFFIKVIFIEEGVGLGHILRGDEQELTEEWKKSFFGID